MGFRTSAKTLVIDVNDNGGTVEIPIDNDRWIKDFLDYVNNIEANSKKHLAAVNDGENEVFHSVVFDEEVRDGFETLFGVGSYEAVFGMELVGFEYVVEFLEYVTGFVDERIKRKNKITEKYNPDRVPK